MNDFRKELSFFSIDCLDLGGLMSLGLNQEEVNWENPRYCTFLLSRAVMREQLGMVNYLLSIRANPNILINNGTVIPWPSELSVEGLFYSPVSIAIESWNVEILNALLKAGGDLNLPYHRSEKPNVIFTCRDFLHRFPELLAAIELDALLEATTAVTTDSQERNSPHPGHQADRLAGSQTLPSPRRLLL